jgi:hypothetical protein
MTQADLARLCDVVRGVSRLLLGAAGVACYLLVRPVVRSVRRRRGELGQQLLAMPSGDPQASQQHLGHGQPSTCRGGQLQGGRAEQVAGLGGEADGDVRHVW